MNRFWVNVVSSGSLQKCAPYGHRIFIHRHWQPDALQTGGDPEQPACGPPLMRRQSSAHQSFVFQSTLCHLGNLTRRNTWVEIRRVVGGGESTPA